MKIDNNTLSFIKNVIRSSQLIGIDNIIIETGRVRAIDDEKTVVILQNEKVPNLPFSSIALNRIGIFTSRLALVDGRENFSIDANLQEKDNQVSLLTMKGEGVKVEYRCANASTISAPRQLHDILKFEVPISAEAVQLLQKAQQAMPQQNSVDIVTIVSNNDGVFFELSDVNGDVFSHKFANKAYCLIENDSDTRFVYRYPIKTLIALFKNNTTGRFSIGQKGIFNILINDLNVYVPPRV